MARRTGSGTASFRLRYQPWQRVYNVGFRVVCEGELKASGITAGQTAAEDKQRVSAR